MKWKAILITKRLVILSLFVSLLSSCYSYRSITRRDPITRDFLLSLEPGKRYKFDLWNGQTEYIDITSVEAETVIGLIHLRGDKGKSNNISYSSSFASIEKDVAKISSWKINPYTTTAISLLGAYATLFIIAIIALEQ